MIVVWTFFLPYLMSGGVGTSNNTQTEFNGEIPALPLSLYTQLSSGQSPTQHPNSYHLCVLPEEGALVHKC